jgi:hypothetical protein
MTYVDDAIGVASASPVTFTIGQKAIGDIEAGSRFD